MQFRMLVLDKCYIIEKIKQAVSYIEGNLQNPFSISDLASHVNYSQYHFQRLFKDFTGYTLKDYIRKRRLASASYDLLTQNKRIISAAYDYNFEYEQSFIRAFKREFGITPGRFRSRGINIPVTKRFSFMDKLNSPKMLLHHGGEYIGVKWDFQALKNQGFELKKTFIKNYFNRIKNKNKFLYCFIMHKSPDLKFFTSYKVEDLISSPSDMEIIKIKSHFSYYYSINRKKSVFNLAEYDLGPQYNYLHNKYFKSLNHHQHDAYRYTVIDTDYMTNWSTDFSIHAPVR